VLLHKSVFYQVILQLILNQVWVVTQTWITKALPIGHEDSAEKNVKTVVCSFCTEGLIG